MKRGRYQSYDPSIKAAIIASRNPNLFPELAVPKSTARHWILKGIKRPMKGIVPAGSKLQLDSDRLEVLALVIRSLGDDINLARLTPDETERLKMQFISGDKALHTYLTVSLKRKLKQALLPCKNSTDGRCLRRFSRQLTVHEVASMKRLVTSRKFAHMSISSLSLWALREGILVCGSQTWYKYIAKHKWLRPHRKKKISPSKRGIHARCPNQIWHIDVSHLVTDSGEKFYLQVILDNFSRFVLAWSLRSRVNANHTQTLIKKAILSSERRHAQSMLIADGGPENKAESVKATLSSQYPRLIRKIARKEIKHANTMVESFFKKLKNNYLYHVPLKNRQTLVAEISFYIKQHNHIVPLRVLDGKTPAETIRAGDVDLSRESLQSKIAARQLFRIEENRSGVCYICS